MKLEFFIIILSLVCIAQHNCHPMESMSIFSSNDTALTVLEYTFDRPNSTEDASPLIEVQPDDVNPLENITTTAPKTEELTAGTLSPSVNKSKVLVFADSKDPKRPALPEVTITAGELMGKLTNDRYIGAIIGGILSIFIVVVLISVCFYLRQRAKRSEKWANAQAEKEVVEDANLKSEDTNIYSNQT